MTEPRRLDPKERKKQIIEHATLTARHNGLYRLTVTEIAERCGVSHGTVFNYFSNIAELRGAIIEHAIAECDVEVLLQAIIDKDPRVDNIPLETRLKMQSKISKLLNL